jgi:hypothetical protein
MFGSPLSVPATLNTAEHLNYKGTDTNVPASPEAPTGVVHTYHYGADGALWNTSIAGGQASAPATGQARKIMLEGCAAPAANGPPPLTQIHFQVLSPTPGGGVKVSLSSGAYDLPVCGRGGASGSTVTTYEPVNLCVTQGDYVAFNEEGGFVEHSYQSGVPYKVIGAVSGSGFDSFIRGGGTNNGDSFSPLDASTMDGFAVNRSAELMMQVALGTGGDATHICAGGTAGLPAALPPIRVSPQTDGINHQRIVSIAVYCDTGMQGRRHAHPPRQEGARRPGRLQPASQQDLAHADPAGQEPDGPDPQAPWDHDDTHCGHQRQDDQPDDRRQDSLTRWPATGPLGSPARRLT